MNRFVAMIWDQDNAAQQTQVHLWALALRGRSPRWKQVLNAPGLAVFSYRHRGETAIVTEFAGAQGVAIGVVFAKGREREGRLRALTEEETVNVVTSGGEDLVRDFWGCYVALWRDAAQQRICVLRDPCGGVPCFVTQSHGVEILFAHAEDVADLRGVNLEINWDFVRAWLAFNLFITEHTGLAGVSEVLGGQRLVCAVGGRELRFLWNGAEIAAGPTNGSFEEASADLRSITERCFTAWGGEYKRAVVALSGGLDSSIVLALLRQTSKGRLIAHHYVGRGYEGYELKLARLSAERAGVPLVENAVDPEQDDFEAIVSAQRLARPALQSIAVHADRLAAGVAEVSDADVFMTGQGGDNLFLQRGLAKQSLADYCRLHGLGNDFWAVAYDTSMLRRDTIWNVISEALLATIRPAEFEHYSFLQDAARMHSQLVRREALEDIADVYKLHPWLSARSGLPPGKSEHLQNVVALYGYYAVRGHGLERDVVLPFFSQPIVEFALRTPTYLFCASGLDRALERCAFGDLLPNDVLRRTSKGGVDSYLLQALRRNIGFVRSLIIDGEIVKRGWIDRDKLERMLTVEHTLHGSGATSIYRLVAAEGWISTWRRARASATLE
jgi:asparagine synthase (glutamine-hydrolysing)